MFWKKVLFSQMLRKCIFGASKTRPPPVPEGGACVVAPAPRRSTTMSVRSTSVPPCCNFWHKPWDHCGRSDWGNFTSACDSITFQSIHFFDSTWLVLVQWRYAEYPAVNLSALLQITAEEIAWISMWLLPVAEAAYLASTWSTHTTLYIVHCVGDVIMPARSE
jgi:hypothetical protein